MSEDVHSTDQRAQNVNDAHHVEVGDVVQTRKGHPCGNDRWQVYRIGADIGLRCLGCDRRVLLPRRQFEKAVKKWISRQGE